MDTPPHAPRRAPQPAGDRRLRVSVRVLAALLAVAVVALIGTLFVNQLFSDSLARAYKKPLHAVEDQLQLDGVGKVVIEREFDNSGLRPLGLGGAVMQANIALTGADVRDRLSARLRSLGYEFEGTTAADDAAGVRETSSWRLGHCRVILTPTSHGADLVLTVSTD